MHEQITDRARFVEPEELICPGCRDEVADESDGFVHVDGSQLCEAEPVEVNR